MKIFSHPNMLNTYNPIKNRTSNNTSTERADFSSKMAFGRIDESHFDKLEQKLAAIMALTKRVINEAEKNDARDALMQSELRALSVKFFGRPLKKSPSVSAKRTVARRVNSLTQPQNPNHGENTNKNRPPYLQVAK